MELKWFPVLQVAIAGAATKALETFRGQSKKTNTRLVDKESSYLTVDFFWNCHHENGEKGNFSCHNCVSLCGGEIPIQRGTSGMIGSDVSSYVSMVHKTLRSKIP